MFLYFILPLLVNGAITTNNYLIGHPNVNCGEDAVEVEITSHDYFRGVVFINNADKVDACHLSYENGKNPTKNLKFTLQLKDMGKCGLNFRRSNNNNAELFFTLVFRLLPNLISGNDRTFTIYCIYPSNPMSITAQLDQTESVKGNGVMPFPVFKVVAGQDANERLNQIQEIKVGEPQTLIWYFNDASEIYGFYVKQCIAETSKGRKSELIVDGCTTDDALMSNVTYLPNNKKAFASGTAFKFADDDNMLIKCTLELCLQPHANIKVDDQTRNILCRTDSTCKARQKRSVDSFNERNIFVLNNKIVVLDSFTNDSIQEGNLIESRPIEHTGICIMKNVLWTGIAFSVILYVISMISLLIFYKFTCQEVDQK